MIYECPSDPDKSTLMATRHRWKLLLIQLPENPRGDDREPVGKIKDAVKAALTSTASNADSDVIRVTLERDLAPRILSLS